MTDARLQALLDVRPRTAPPPIPAAGVRLNLGSGIDRKEGWINVDTDPRLDPDVCADAVAYLETVASDSVDEIYAGHFLEHLDHDAGAHFVRECHRVLKPAARIGIVVPDTRAIAERYVSDSIDLDDVCLLWLYSTVQDTHHKWSYDLVTLRRVLELADLVVGAEIDRFDDPRVHAGAWWQCGLDGVKPRRRRLWRRG